MNTTFSLELPKDIDGKQIELGHIVGVRYVWNSYAGVVTVRGLHVGGRFHPISDDGTYQILGHENKEHPDYNNEVSVWIEKYFKGKDYGECPVPIRVYDNCKKETL